MIKNVYNDSYVENFIVNTNKHNLFSKPSYRKEAENRSSM